jgi:hypothetical protein
VIHLRPEGWAPWHSVKPWGRTSHSCPRWLILDWTLTCPRAASSDAASPWQIVPVSGLYKHALTLNAGARTRPISSAARA